MKIWSKDTFFKTTIHIGVFKIWKCKQCDSFLQPSFVNRTPLYNGMSHSATNLVVYNPVTLYYDQLISNNIDKDYKSHCTKCDKLGQKVTENDKI